MYVLSSAAVLPDASACPYSLQEEAILDRAAAKAGGGDAAGPSTSGAGAADGREHGGAADASPEDVDAEDGSGDNNAEEVAAAHGANGKGRELSDGNAKKASKPAGEGVVSGKLKAVVRRALRKRLVHVALSMTRRGAGVYLHAFLKS